MAAKRLGIFWSIRCSCYPDDLGRGKASRVYSGLLGRSGRGHHDAGLFPEQRQLSGKIAAYDAVIASATAEDLTILAQRFWEFEEQEDEGACYAFELVAGGVIFISGQDFYPGARFPTTDFSIVEFRDSGGCALDKIIVKRGTRTTPERVISAKEKAHLAIPEHGSFFPGTLEEVFAKLSGADLRAF